MGVFKQLKKLRKKEHKAMLKLSKGKIGNVNFGKISKKVGQEFVKVAKVSEVVGGVIEKIGVITKQPEIIALGAGIEIVGALGSGHPGKVIQRALEAAGVPRKISKTIGKVVPDIEVHNNKIRIKKKRKHKNKDKPTDDEPTDDEPTDIPDPTDDKPTDIPDPTDDKPTDIPDSTNIPIEPKPVDLDLSSVNERLDSIKEELVHQSKQNELLTSELNEGLDHLDQEEELVKQELQNLEELEKTQIEQQDNLEEIILEGNTKFDDVDDFFQQIDKLEDFDESLDMLIRQQDNFENLTEEEQLQIIELISNKF